MPSKAVTLLAVTATLAPLPTAAQDVTVEEAVERAASSAIEAILGAIRLPDVVDEAREAGVSDSTLTGILDDLRASSLPAADAEELLDQEVEAVRAGGPVDNFGAFVQARLADGLRGRELADAIRAEHRAMGIGMPERRPDRDLRRGMRGRDGAARGGPAGRGGPGERGARPDTAGGDGGPPDDREPRGRRPGGNGGAR